MSLEHEYWEKRTKDSPGDWADGKNFLESYRASVSHPHRQLIIGALKEMPFRNLLEIGCCNGPNLINIRLNFPLAFLKGEDINREAINDAAKYLQAEFDVIKLPEIAASDKSYDVVLADAVLMYVEDIDKALQEMKRVARKTVIIFDWFTEDERKINHSYTRDYKKRLKDLGFTNIQIKPLLTWPSENWIKYGRFITAQVP